MARVIALSFSHIKEYYEILGTNMGNGMASQKSLRSQIEKATDDKIRAKLLDLYDRHLDSICSA